MADTPEPLPADERQAYESRIAELECAVREDHASDPDWPWKKVLLAMLGVLPPEVLAAAGLTSRDATAAGWDELRAFLSNRTDDVPGEPLGRWAVRLLKEADEQAKRITSYAELEAAARRLCTWDFDECQTHGTWFLRAGKDVAAALEKVTAASTQTAEAHPG